jgi:lipopolysaccharide/colanic/teichoic acid biosynthesis glycosyltransferase
MIIRDEDERRTWLRRTWQRWLGTTGPGINPRLLSESAFALAVRKEISRSDRRTLAREFCLLILRPQGDNSRNHGELLQLLAGRLRITDELGTWQGELCALLPETDAQGAGELSRQLVHLAGRIPVELETEVRVYPWDDRIISRSDELVDSQQVLHGERQLETDRIDAGNSACEETELARRAFFGGESEVLRSPATPVWKRGFDLLASAFGLLVLSPILVAAALAIRLDSRGPIFFTQLREGRNGEVFRIIKFRTMRPDAEQLRDLLEDLNEQDGPAFKIEADPRVTRVGRYLRKTCIDELPQLINVLRGEMSIVGPRPLPVGESYASRTWHRRRLTVLPGLTCIWQVEGARQVTFDQWMRMDLEYIRRRSPWFDLKLIARTAMVVLSHRGSV